MFFGPYSPKILLFAVLTTLIIGCGLGQKLRKRSGVVKVYAFPVNTFTRIPISIYSIQDAADTVFTDTKQFRYIVQLDSLLRQSKPAPDSIFDNAVVRTAICASPFETIYLDKQSDIYYRKMVYHNTRETYDLIKHLFPRPIRDRYLREPRTET